MVGPQRDTANEESPDGGTTWAPLRTSSQKLTSSRVWVFVNPIGFASFFLGWGSGAHRDGRRVAGGGGRLLQFTTWNPITDRSQMVFSLHGFQSNQNRYLLFSDEEIQVSGNELTSIGSWNLPLTCLSSIVQLFNEAHCFKNYGKTSII